MLLIPPPSVLYRHISVFVASFNLPLLVCIRYLIRGRGEPERGRRNYKKEGNDVTRRQDDGGIGHHGLVIQLDNTAIPTGITPVVIDIFRGDSFEDDHLFSTLPQREPEIIHDPMRRIDLPRTFHRACTSAKSPIILNNVVIMSRHFRGFML